MIQMHDISKVYGEGDAAVHALRSVNLTVERGEFVAVIGPSGCGKSTLMNIMGCLDRPTSGTYLLDESEVQTLDDEALSAVRGSKIGFVFQSFILLAQATALENVELPALYDRAGRDLTQRARELLEQVGLGDRAEHLPAELSGGQQQRVAIARSLIMDPAIILADEPTGALDTRSGLEVMTVFQDLNADGRTIVVVTHDRAIADHARRIITLADGEIAGDEAVAEPLDARQELASPTEEVQAQ